MSDTKTQNDALKDLEYIRTLAAEGANTPLLGGAIGLMWGILLTPTLLLHGLILIDVLPIEKSNVGFLWMAYGIVGTILSIILGKRIERRHGAQSTLNKTGSALGISLGIMIFVYAITTVFTVIQNGLPLYMYNFIIVFAFGLMTINSAVLTKLSGFPYLRNTAFMAGAFMVITLLMVTQNHVYFIAAIGILMTQVIPSFIEIKNERNHG